MIKNYINNIIILSYNNNMEEYFTKLKEKIKEKELNDFWILGDRSDFKPIKNANKKSIKKMLKEKSQYYKNKHICNVKLIFKSGIKFSKIDEEEWIFSIVINVYNIEDDGELDTDDTSLLMINYDSDELLNNKFTLAELNEIIGIATDRKVVTDLTGITYSSYKKKI
jgi:hypothetical protein